MSSEMELGLGIGVSLTPDRSERTDCSEKSFDQFGTPEGGVVDEKDDSSQKTVIDQTDGAGGSEVEEEVSKENDVVVKDASKDSLSQRLSSQPLSISQTMNGRSGQILSGENDKGAGKKKKAFVAPKPSKDGVISSQTTNKSQSVDKSGTSQGECQPPSEKVEATTSKKLNRQDVTCPICWEVLYEPTTLPCKHSLCIKCFLKHVDETSLYCPCCRRRLSVWSRKTAKKNELLDTKLWERIKNEFADAVELRAAGLDESQSSSSLGNSSQISDVPFVRDAVLDAPPGSIFKELKEMLVPHENDVKTQRQLEEDASVNFIEGLLQNGEAENPVEMHKTEKHDRLLAQKLNKELNGALENDNTPKLPQKKVLKKSTAGVCRNLTQEFENVNETKNSTVSSAPTAKPKKKWQPKFKENSIKAESTSCTNPESEKTLKKEFLKLAVATCSSKKRKSETVDSAKSSKSKKNSDEPSTSEGNILKTLKPKKQTKKALTGNPTEPVQRKSKKKSNAGTMEQGLSNTASATNQGEPSSSTAAVANNLLEGSHKEVVTDGLANPAVPSPGAESTTKDSVENGTSKAKSKSESQKSKKPSKKRARESSPEISFSSSDDESFDFVLPSIPSSPCSMEVDEEHGDCNNPDEEGASTSAAAPEVKKEPGWLFSPFSVKMRLHDDDYFPSSSVKPPAVNSQNENDEIIVGDEEYSILQKEAAMLEEMKRKMLQEQEDLKLAKSLQQNFDLGITSPRGKHAGVNKYNLRGWSE